MDFYGANVSKNSAQHVPWNFEFLCDMARDNQNHSAENIECNPARVKRFDDAMQKPSETAADRHEVTSFGGCGFMFSGAQELRQVRQMRLECGTVHELAPET
jgi:hypothetical protein